jgi:hypothetical protein
LPLTHAPAAIAVDVVVVVACRRADCLFRESMLSIAIAIPCFLFPVPVPVPWIRNSP